MTARTPRELLRWLARHTALDELATQYPDEWQTVQRELAQLATTGKVEQLQAYLRELAPRSRQPPRHGQSRGQVEREAALRQVRYQLAHAALQQQSLALATGVEEGKLRFNLLNGWLLQKLLFVRDFERKPVSLFWFRLLWPLLWQRRLLMPLVQQKGIYCFYARPLVAALAELIGAHACLEIAAGDGTLSRFLRQAGVAITATDDHSWRHAVTFPAEVQRLDAEQALTRHAPAVVLCAWPPAGNRFERKVFATRSVQRYVVISSRHQFAAGNWPDYLAQTQFSVAEAPALSRWVLPPELDAGVYIFARTREATHGDPTPTP